MSIGPADVAWLQLSPAQGAATTLFSTMESPYKSSATEIHTSTLSLPQNFASYWAYTRTLALPTICKPIDSQNEQTSHWKHTSNSTVTCSNMNGRSYCLWHNIWGICGPAAQQNKSLLIPSSAIPCSPTSQPTAWTSLTYDNALRKSKSLELLP